MQKEKHTLNKFILIISTVIFCLIPVFFLICGFILPAQYDDTFLGEMKYKLERLENTEGKRIVFVGGSSIPFALKSELVKKYFPDYEIIDFGMYADMGTVVMLDWAKTEVHEGDIFILMPEQNEQTLSCYFSGQNVWQAADGDFDLIIKLSFSRFEKVAASFAGFSYSKFKYFINGRPDIKGIYVRSSFNEYSDIEYSDREYNIMSGGYNPNQLTSFSESVISDDFIDEMNDFADYVSSKGASVYYHFSPINKASLAESTSKALIDSYYDYLSECLDFPILGNPHSCILESGWFYDTNFHLNESGAVLFTKTLIQELKTLFMDTSVTDIAAPIMPDIPVFTVDGDNSYADCFTYKRVMNGWLADGLTEKGQAASTLVVPTYYNEEPVTGISNSLFIGNTTLESITFSSNIGILYDGMFEGCSYLKEVILTGQPSSYSIGDLLMYGADFNIYVPSSLLDSYRRHYSWQRYNKYIISRKEISQEVQHQNP